MSLSGRPTALYMRRLNSRLRTNPAWAEFFTAVDNVVRKQITAPREQLAKVRDPRLYHRGNWIDTVDNQRAVINHIDVAPDGSTNIYAQVYNRGEVVNIQVETNNQDRDVIIANVRRKGLRYFSDKLTTDDYARINEWLESYWPTSGTLEVYKFIGWILNIRLESDALWTSDYGDQNSDTVAPGVVSVDANGQVHNLIEEASIGQDEFPYLEPNLGDRTGTWAGGHDYPTSHIQLRYDPLRFTNVDHESIFYLFYFLAPIELLLRRICQEIQADGGTLLTHVHGQMADYNSGLARWDCRTRERDLLWAEMGAISWWTSGTAALSYQSVKDIYVALSAGFSFSNFFREGFQGPQFLDADNYRYRLTIINQNTNQTLALATVENGRLYFSDDGALVCSIPPTAVPINLTDNYTYILQRATIASTAGRSLLGYRTYFTGNMIVEGAVPIQSNQQDLLVNVSDGFTFSGVFTDVATGGPVAQDGYEFKIDFVRDADATVVAEATSDNGRLYWDGNGHFACVVPPVAAPVDITQQYSYNLYRKLITDPDTAYVLYIAGLILVENV